MCGPVVFAAASLAITAGSAYASHKAQGQAEKANREAAERAFKANVREMGTQQLEVEQTVAERLLHTERRVRSTRSLAAVGAGEAGVAGVSADEVLSDIEREGADVARSIRRQRDRDISALQRAKTNQTDLMMNRISQVGKPSPVALGLQIAGAGLDFGQFMISRNPPSSTDTDDTGDE